jgi:predicted porin
MKKALLGTTALVASGLLAGAASAADIVPAPIPEPVEIEEGFTLSIEMDSNAFIAFGETDECEGDPILTDAEQAILGIVDNPDGDGGGAGGTQQFTSSCAFQGSVDNTDQFHDEVPTMFFETKIAFALEATLASGLFVGAYTEIEKAGGDDVKDAWIVLEGHFGSMEIGFTDGAYKNSLTGGLDSGIYAEADGPKIAPLNDINTSDGSLDNGKGDLLIGYYTPRFHGIQVGVSYAPDSNDDEEFADGRHHPLDSDDGWVHNWQVGASWEGTIHENWEFEIGGGVGGGEAETGVDAFVKCQGGGDDPKAADAFGGINGDFECGDYDVWGLGAVVTNGHVSVGGMYTQIDYDFGFEREHWEVSTVLHHGDWNFGVHYANEQDTHFLGGTDERDLVAVGADTELGADVVWGVFGAWAEEHEAWEKAIGHGSDDAFLIGTGWKLN